MTSPLAIEGIGIVAGFGYGNKTALMTIQNGSGPNSTLPVQTEHGAIDYPVYIADPAPLKQYLKAKELRRVNKYSRLGTLAASLTLEDAHCDPVKDDLRLGVIVASGYGASTTTFKFLDDVILEGDEFASPTQFSNSVHSAAASHITILLGIQSPTLTVTQFEMSTIAALLNAQAWLENDVVDAVLLGNVEEVNPVLMYCYHNLWNTPIPKSMEPLNFQNQTAIPGEGAAFILLRKKDNRSSKYSVIDSLIWTDSNDVKLPEGKLIIPNADGHKTCGKQYKKLLNHIDADHIKTFSQLVGSMPTGQMFDIVFSCLSQKEGLTEKSILSVKVNQKKECAIVSLKSNNTGG